MVLKLEVFFLIYPNRGIKPVIFSSKIKRKNQERFSVIYTELVTIPRFHRIAGANQARRKRRSLQADR